MNFFDIVFTAIILIFLIYGFARGSLRALLAAVGISLGYVIAERFHETYIGITLQFIASYALAKIITYMALFAVGIIVGILFSAIIRLMFSVQNPSFPSRILGGILGILMGALVCLLIMFVVEAYIPSFTDDLLISVYTSWLKSFKSIISGINFAFFQNKPPV